MLTIKEASVRALSAPLTVGDLRAAIMAKVDSQEKGQVNPFATLENAASGYLEWLSGRADAEQLVVMAERTDRARVAHLDHATMSVVPDTGMRMRTTPDYIIALCILRDFG